VDIISNIQHSIMNEKVNLTILKNAMKGNLLPSILKGRGRGWVPWENLSPLARFQLLTLTQNCNRNITYKLSI
jgi:hypothetical protein